jgi:hypothetical protein
MSTTSSPSPPQPVQPSTDPVQGLQAQPAILQATIHVTRKATGKVETYHLTGTPVLTPKEA